MTFFVTYSYKFCWLVQALSIKNQYGGRIKRSLVIVAGLMVVCSPPTAAPTPATPSDVTAINVVGRTLNLSMPLRFNTKLLDDLGVRIETDGEILLDQATLWRLLLPLLKPAGAKLLQSVSPIDGFVSLRQLNATGLNIVYDSLHTEIVLQLKTEQALATGISLRPNSNVEAIQPTTTHGLSAFINLFNSVQTAYNPTTRELFEYQPGNFRILSDGAIHYGGLSLIGEGSFNDRQGFSRAGTRLNYDYVAEQVRFQLGDVITPTVSTQTSVDLLGLSILRSASTISAGAPFRPTGSQSFYLATPARVEIYINGAFSRRLNLEAGEFNLQDLGFSTGANDIKLVIEDEAGRRSELNFGLFISGAQLGEGVNEFGVAVGISAQSEMNQNVYDESEAVMAGFFRYGVADWLTLGINAQSANNINRYGSEMIVSTAIGAFGVDTAYVEQEAEADFDFRLRYDLPQHNSDIKGTRRGFSFNLERQAEKLSEAVTTTTVNSASGNKYRLGATYWQDVMVDYRLNLSTTHAWDADNTETDFIATLSRQYRRLSTNLTLGTAHDLGLYVELGINLNLGEGEHSKHVSANYDGRIDQVQFNYSKLATNTIGASGYQISETYSKGSNTLDGSITYRANRFDLEAAQQISTIGKWDNVETSRTNLRANTAVVFADGGVGLSRPVTESFAIISTHSSIADKKLKVGGYKDHVQYQSDFLGPAVINDLSAYSKREIAIDVDDLPLGYDLGASGFSVTPSYKSGYRFNVGSGYSVILVADLVDKHRQPMSLKVGFAHEVEAVEKTPIQAFTNKKGRLVVQGLRPGNWLLKFRDNKDNELHYNINIPTDAAGVVRIKTLSPSN